jgi:hypothetical protein
MEVKEDPARIEGMSAEIKRYIKDKELLRKHPMWMLIII